MEIDLLKSIPGRAELVDWFDERVPSFHDAEILTLTLDRQAARCSFNIHTFQMTPETDETGHFDCIKHVVVVFKLEQVIDLELTDFNHQNAIFGLDIVQIADGGFRVELEPAYGLFGHIDALSLTIELIPGVPADSIYAEQNRAS